MRLRPTLMACVAAALGLATLQLASLVLDARLNDRMDRQREAVDVMARDAAGLLVLTQEYGLYRSSRAALQWQLVHQRLSQALTTYAVVDAQAADDVDELQAVAKDLPKVFDTLSRVDASPGNPEGTARRETLIDQLINDTRRISDGSFDLSNQMTEKRRAAAVGLRWLGGAAQGLWLAITVGLAWLLRRRVLAPIDLLRATAERVQGGDYTPRADVPQQDELGDLSRALNSMTAALSEREAALQRSNAQVTRSEAFQTRAGQIAGVGSWELEVAGQQLSWSAQTFSIHDMVPGDEPPLAEAMSCYPPEAQQTLQAAMDQAVQDRCGWDLELPFRSFSGRKSWVRVVGAPQGEDGQDAGPVVRLVGALQDVTARRVAEDKLRHALRSADAANAAKSAFLANMSHEIRTPMNAVLGLGYLLANTPLNPRQQDLLSKSTAASRHLLELINSLLDLSKIEAGEMLLEHLPFDIRELVQETTDLLRPQAEAKGLMLSLEVAPDVPVALSGDRLRMRQILSNLLSNAIKFTQNGQVTLQLTQAGTQEGAEQLVLTVDDTGIGIPADAMARLFRPFSQVDESTSRRFGGTGLGLSIVKHLIDLMDGRVDVSSVPGQGSRFTVTLPLQRVATAASANRRLSLLLAFRDALPASQLQRACEAFGWDAECVNDGDALLQQLAQADSAGTQVDLLLLDDGLAQGCTESQRQALSTWAERLPCLLMAAARTDEQERSHWLHPSRMLALPTESSVLFDAVHAAMWKHGSDLRELMHPGADGRATLCLLPGVRVLVVDDSAINLEVAERILNHEGAVVSLALDGERAVAKLRATPQAFDIVLMDVQMPTLDGLAATRIIREQLQLTQLPILALTAGALLSERQRAMEAGMNGFVSKPFDPVGLIMLLRQHIERSRGQRLPTAARAADPTSKPEDWPPLGGIDIAEAQRRLQADLPLFARLLRRLLSENADLLNLAADTPAGAERSAARFHKLVGTAGLLAAHDVRDAALEAEAAWLRPEQSAASRLPALAQLSATLKHLNSAGQAWLARHDARTEPLAAPASGALEAADLASFRQALSSQNLAALGQFKRFAPALQASLPADRWAQLTTAMDSLDFANARLALDALA